MNSKEKPVPEQATGMAIEASADAVLNTGQEAVELFHHAVNRLQRVSDWNRIATGISAKFTLVDSTGTKLNRAPAQGDYFKVDIPGPGSTAGKGFDWVRVEEVIRVRNGDTEQYGLRVRPSENPTGSTNETAHFYAPEATSTFLITRINNTVTAEIFDRNIKPNQEATSAVDKIRDVAIGTVGLAGFSKLQWNGLAEGLVAHNKNR